MKVLLSFLAVLILAPALFAASIEPPAPHLLPPPVPLPPIISDAWIRLEGDNLLFALFFADTPDFQTKDEYARPKTSFQWYLSTNPNASNPIIPLFTTFVVRGDGMASGNVKVCTVQPIGSGCPGGWGLDLTDLATIYDDDFMELTFSAPAQLFGTSAMSFDVISMEYGAQRDKIHGAILSTPSPGLAPPQAITQPVGVSEASSLVLAGLAMVGLVGLKRITARVSADTA